MKTKSPTVAALQAQIDGAHARIKDLETREARLEVLAGKVETAWQKWLDSSELLPTEDFIESLGTLIEAALGRLVKVG